MYLLLDVFCSGRDLHSRIMGLESCVGLMLGGSGENGWKMGAFQVEEGPKRLFEAQAPSACMELEEF